MVLQTMATLPQIKTANTILYCRQWRETVDFYQRRLGLPVTFASSWFVEFRLSDTARLSVADERRASVKSAGGAGITVTLQVESADLARRALQHSGLTPGPVKDHPWGARVFYLADPEGHRLEFWSPA
jgi:uncharacterized glyoxalase superfamily protein PhnB